MCTVYSTHHCPTKMSNLPTNKKPRHHSRTSIVMATNQRSQALDMVAVEFWQRTWSFTSLVLASSTSCCSASNQWLFLWKDSYGFLRSESVGFQDFREFVKWGRRQKVGVFSFSKLLFKGNTEGWRGPPVFWWISKVRISTWSFFWPVGLLVELYGST